MKRLISLLSMLILSCQLGFAPPPPPDSNNDGAPLGSLAWVIGTALIGGAIGVSKRRRG